MYTLLDILNIIFLALHFLSLSTSNFFRLMILYEFSIRHKVKNHITKNVVPKSKTKIGNNLGYRRLGEVTSEI